MRLKEDNIRFVKVLTADGIQYEIYVAMKDRSVSSGRSYKSLDDCPATVKRFCAKRTGTEFWTETFNGVLYKHYIYN